MPNFKIDYSQLGAFAQDIRKDLSKAGQDVQKAVRDSTLIVYSKAVENTPVKTGTLRRSHRFIITPLTGKIYPTVKYASPVHDGTKPHVIRPKKAKALMFKIGPKAFVFTKKVNHPGTKAQPFYSDALDATKSEVTKIFDDAGVKITYNVTRGGKK